MHTKRLLVPLALLGLGWAAPRWTIATPLVRGSAPSATPAPEAERVLFLTHARLRSVWAGYGAFGEQLDRLRALLPTQPGLLAHSLRRQPLGREVWTLSVWDSATSLEAFVRSAPHRRAMREAGPSLMMFRSARARLAPGEPLPTWTRALRLLQDSPTTASTSPAPCPPHGDAAPSAPSPARSS